MVETDANGRVTVSWGAAAKADSYNVELYPSDNPDVVWGVVNGAFSGGVYGGYGAWRAFDVSTATEWRSSQFGSITGVAWIAQDLTKARTITRVGIKQSAVAANRLSSALLQYSDDGVNWSTSQALTLIQDGNNNAYALTTPSSHRFWRLLANSNLNPANNWYVYNFGLRADGAAVTPLVANPAGAIYSFTPAARSYTAHVRGNNTTCGGNVYSEWSNWVSFTATSPVSGTVYYDAGNTAVLSGGVCTGTGAGLPAGGGDVTSTTTIATGGGYYGGNSYVYAFDNNNNTYWLSPQRGSAAIINTAFIGQNFGATNYEIVKVSIRQYPNSLNRVSKVYVDYADAPPGAWSVLTTLDLPNDSNTHTFFLPSGGAHSRWRLRAASGLISYDGNARSWAVSEIEMFPTGGNVGTLTAVGQDYLQYSDQATVDNGTGAYSINLPYSNTGTNQVSLVLEASSPYICSCPTGCTYSGVNSPLSGLNFYITDIRLPWFQAIGGSVAAFGAEGVVINDPIPSSTCTGSCKPYLLTRNGTTASSSGLLLTGGGSADLSAETGQQTLQVDEDDTRRVGIVNAKIAQQNYEYFYKLYKFPPSPASDFGSGAPDAAKPTGAPVNANVNAYYHGGDLTIQDPWQVDALESRVIFVDGDLNLKNTVLVAPTGFLAFFVSGDIIIDANLGHTDPTAPTSGNSIVEGVYVANGRLLLPSRGEDAGGDYKFVGEGTFVGWGGVELDRNYADTATRGLLNNTNPAEVFRYRPDFLVRSPQELKVARTEWREVAP